MNSHALQDQTAAVITKLLQQSGFPIAVVVTDSDRLQGAMIEAQVMLTRGNEVEARRILRDALNDQ